MTGSAAALLHLGPDCTGSPIEIKGTAVQPSRPIKISITSISGNKWNGVAVSGNAGVPYVIDMTAGELQLSNVSMNGEPTTAFVHIGPNVALGAVDPSGGLMVSNRSKTWHDERPFSTLNLGSVDVPARYVYQGTTPVAPELSADQVIYKMAQNVLTDWAGSVTVPSDAAVDRPIRVRVLWYSPATAGKVRLEAGVKRGQSGGSTDVATAAESKVFVGTVPPVANTLVQTTMEFTATAKPGQIVPIRLSRNGGDVTDTLDDSDIRISQVALRYEWAF